MSQTFLLFEQQAHDAEQAAKDAEQAAKDAEQAAKDAEQAAKAAALARRSEAKAAAVQARADAKRKEESEKLSRRLAREAAYRAKHPPGRAQCGINWYPAGSGWTHCHRCGQALVYTTDPNAKPQECGARLSTLNTQLSTHLDTTDPHAKPQECQARQPSATYARPIPPDSPATT